MDALKQLQNLLRDLFQLDLADLDFGLYRLLRLKRQEVEAFLTEQLPRRVDEAFESAAGEERGVFENDISELADRIRKEVAEDAILESGELNREYRDTKVRAARKLLENYEARRRQLQAVQATEAQKAEVFNHLYAFFSRYYETGDFIPRRRYGARESYAVPYSGEETVFHWANKDQHYVKTAEAFRDYAFALEALGGPFRVRFALTEASLPPGNTKGDTRYFFPLPDRVDWEKDSRTLRVPFHYRLPEEKEIEKLGKNSRLQEAILKGTLPKILHAVPDDALRALLSATVEQKEDQEISLLLKRLRHFTRRNTTDYFVHRDLEGFLKRQLEFYVKDQVMHLGDLEGDLEAKRRTLRVIRQLAEEVIAFLAQIEDVQKRLFEKKKFVLRTDYLVPIKEVPHSLWKEVLANKAQVEEWEQLFAIECKKVRLNEQFLKDRPTLVVSTAHFPLEFKNHLLTAFDDLDGATEGLLIHAENYQALRLLERKYEGQVRCIYIDPPYNTSEGTFLYKNNYKHSSWIAMMVSRLAVAYRFLPRDGVMAVAIDDTEKHHLRMIMQNLFGNENYVTCIAAEVNPAGQNLRPNVPAISHDYCIVFARDIEQMEMLLRELTPEEEAQYSEKDEKGSYLWDNLRRRGGNSRPADRPGQWFPLYADMRTRKVSVEAFKGAQEVWPIDPQGERRIWRVNPAGARREIAAGEISVIEKAGRPEIVKKTRMPEGKKPKTLWKDSRYSATTYGTKLLIDILAEQLFSYPKSIYLVEDCVKHWAGPGDTVVDFFAGSGTTGHAVVNLNRADDGGRKFILAELGEYFDHVLLRRVKKVIHAPEWKDGKPKRLPTEEEVERTPRLVKVLRLEGYEDALHNLSTDETLKREEPRAKAHKERLGDHPYRLSYLVRLPLKASASMLNVAALEHPFDYQIEVLTEDGPKVETVDLVETFNFLYGLHVERLETWENSADKRRYRAVKARKLNGERVLVLWRDMRNLDPVVERRFLEANLKGEGSFVEMLINGDTATPGVKSLDGLFKRLLEEGEK